jgi:hypothetical protein
VEAEHPSRLIHVEVACPEGEPVRKIEILGDRHSLIGFALPIPIRERHDPPLPRDGDEKRARRIEGHKPWST